jgi:prepilin signal peptidase PulO-like enzyme (type II secretory pathway)
VRGVQFPIRLGHRLHVVRWLDQHHRARAEFEKRRRKKPQFANAGLAMIDVRTRTLPDMITAPLLVVGVTVNAFHVFTGIAGAIEGAAVGFGLLWGANHLYRSCRNKHAIGVGDMKLAAAAGAWLGVAGIWQALAIASVCMFAWGLATRIRAGVSAQGAVPFGPVISFACAVSLLFPLGNIR